MFGEAASSQGAMNFEGTNISWIKTGTDVTLNITETNGNVTNITVPIASFGF